MTVNEYGPLGNPLPTLDDDANFPDQITELSVWAAKGYVPEVNDPSQLKVLYPTARQGLIARVLSVGELWMYYAAYNAASNPGGKSPAGWYRVNGSGRLLNTYEFDWSGGGFRWPDAVKLLTGGKIIPAQGVPYRIQVSASAEVGREPGTPSNAPRYDFAVLASAADASGTTGTILGSAQEGPGIAFQQFTTVPSARIFTGETQLSMVAYRNSQGVPAPLGQYGDITAFNRRLVATVWQA